MFKLPIGKNKNSTPDFPPKGSLVSIDIGTEVLKVVNFKIAQDLLTVNNVAYVNQQQHAMSKGKIQNLDTVLENCRLAINEVTNGLEPEDYPKQTVMGIAGEYIQGVSIIVNYAREEKFDKEVTQSEESKIIQRVHEQISEEGKEDLALRTGLVSEDIEILHITVTGMEIGGMKTDTIVGYRGKDVKIYFYASFAPKTYTEALKKVANSLEMELIGITSQPFAVARAYAGARNKDFSAIFVDIGGGTTDVAIVQDGNVLDTQMYAFGGRVFTKEIAREMNIDYRHAELRKIKYSNGELDKKIQTEVRKAVYPTAELWMKSLAAALEMVEDVDIFPSQIFLCGGGAMLPEIRNVMMEFPWTQLLRFKSVPKVNIFLPERLHEIKDETGKLNNAYDVTPTAIARFGYDKLANPGNYYYNPK